MARRRSRRRKSSYSDSSDKTAKSVEIEELSPRARRLVESGVIDLEAISGSGPDGSITSGDILHAARVMEMEQSVPRIERTSKAVSEYGDSDDPETAEEAETVQEPEGAAISEPGSVIEVPEAPLPESGTSTTAQVGGEPLSVAPDPWDAYNGSSEGLSESALPGAEQSWGEAEANIAAIADEAAANDADDGESEATEHAEDTGDSEPEEAVVATDEIPVQEQGQGAAPSDQPEEQERETATPDESAVIDSVPEVSELDTEDTESIADLVAAANEAIATTAAPETLSPEVSISEDGTIEHESDVAPPDVAESQGEVMMDFGTLELVDPDSVWAEGVEDFAPWFLAHSQQLGDVLGLEAGLSEARQFTTKSATGVLGRDDNGEDVVVVSSKNATADDSDLGRALGMAASSGAASVALVSAALHEDQLKALAWLNNQTKSGVKWYGIEMQVVRIADSPAAMMFTLVASPPQG